MLCPFFSWEQVPPSFPLPTSMPTHRVRRDDRQSWDCARAKGSPSDGRDRALRGIGSFRNTCLGRCRGGYLMDGHVFSSITSLPPQTPAPGGHARQVKGVLVKFRQPSILLQFCFPCKSTRVLVFLPAHSHPPFTLLSPRLARPLQRSRANSRPFGQQSARHPLKMANHLLGPPNSKSAITTTQAKAVFISPAPLPLASRRLSGKMANFGKIHKNVSRYDGCLGFVALLG